MDDSAPRAGIAGGCRGIHHEAMANQLHHARGQGNRAGLRGSVLVESKNLSIPSHILSCVVQHHLHFDALLWKPSVFRSNDPFGAVPVVPGTKKVPATPSGVKPR
jgi:hypothetical protein